jgi:hypothetical protein
MHREVVQVDGTCAVREPCEAYGEFVSENEAPMVKNTIPWQKNDTAWSDPVNSDFNRL